MKAIGLVLAGLAGYSAYRLITADDETVDRVWPIRNTNREVPRIVDGKEIDNTLDGVSSNRYFGAKRQGGRVHAGVDLLASPGDVVQAIEGGTIVSFPTGYVGLGAVAIANINHVLVYAEFDVLPGLTRGERILPGDVLGVAAKSSQGTELHIEEWSSNTRITKFVPWYEKDIRPNGLIDPTSFLLSLR